MLVMLDFACLQVHENGINIHIDPSTGCVLFKPKREKRPVRQVSVPIYGTNKCTACHLL